MLPVEMIRRVFTDVGATEDQILRAQANYFALGVGKERDDYLHSLEVTYQSQKFLKVLEDAIDIKYDKDGVPETMTIKPI